MSREPVVFVVGDDRALCDSIAFTERHGGRLRAEANGAGAARFVPEPPCATENP